MEIGITCGNKRCAWTFTINVNDPIAQHWICPKCGTDQSQKSKARGTPHWPKGLDPDLVAALKGQGWTVWPPQAITQVKRGSVVIYEKKPDK